MRRGRAITVAIMAVIATAMAAAGKRHHRFSAAMAPMQCRQAIIRFIFVGVDTAALTGCCA
jgi:hypothetical protein